MKNIHILSTDKPSRIRLFNDELYLSGINFIEATNKLNICITNSEEIKEGDWYMFIDSSLHGQFEQAKRVESQIPYHNCKKIVLTTDKNLIENGVQAIDDEFLKWFLNNQNCECVEVVKQLRFDAWKKLQHDWYEIIIPKKEHKQESKEDVECNNCGNLMWLKEDKSVFICINSECTSFYDKSKIPTEHCSDCHKLLQDCTCIEDTVDMKQKTLEEAGLKHCDILDKFPQLVEPLFSFKEGAKWQQKRSYSEEETLEFLQNFNKHTLLLQSLKLGNSFKVEEWFEQFKKK